MRISMIGKMRFLGQREAQRIDEALMSSLYGFSIDQLMELAGLSVACAVAKEFQQSKRVLIAAGPGNNGGDALVAARHLKHFGFEPTIFYPKRSAKPLFQGLVTQCERLEIPFIEKLDTTREVDSCYDVILDGIFGFSFEGSIRAPFDTVISTLRKCNTPIVSIDIPSGWNVEKGNEQGMGLEPQMLVSLTAPKLCSEKFAGIHYLGGRFVPSQLSKEFQLDLLPTYPGVEQCVKL